MNIKKFTKQEFGSLTAITNENTGVVMFIASEVGKIWGHSNVKQSVIRLLNKEEYKVICKSSYPEFFNILVSNKLLQSKAQRIQLITESGLFKLALASNLKEAIPFRDWVTCEVLPSIRKKGYYSFANQTQEIMLNTNISIQKQNSKDINSKNLIEKGLDGVIEYNKNSCLLHTGKMPHEIKEDAKKLGLKSKERISAKEVLRHTNPALACSMSFTDSLVKNGFDLKTCSELSLKAALPLFQGMIELGIKPKEIND